MSEQSTEIVESAPESVADGVAVETVTKSAAPAATEQTFADDEVAGERVMQKIIGNETIARARATIARIEKIDWGLEHRKQRHRISKARAEQIISDVEWRVGQAEQVRRRERAPKIIYKDYDETWVAKQKAKQARYRETVARARQLLGHEEHDQRDNLVYKVRDNAPEPAPSERTQMTDQTETNPYLVLAEELGIVAARIEKDAIKNVKTLKAELELHFERRIAEQQKEVSELRGMIKALLAARAEPEPIDFGEARAAVRN